MLMYKAAYQFVDGTVHAHVLDFPGAITCAADLAEARRLLASALLDLAEYALEQGESLPRPDPSLADPDADVEEPIYLHLRGKPRDGSTDSRPSASRNSQPNGPEDLPPVGYTRSMSRVVRKSTARSWQFISICMVLSEACRSATRHTGPKES